MSLDFYEPTFCILIFVDEILHGVKNVINICACCVISHLQKFESCTENPLV